MKKLILIVFFAVFVIPLGYLVIFHKNSKKIFTSNEKQSSETTTKTNIVRVEGVITDVHNGCWAEGICSIKVNGEWWIQIKSGNHPMSPNSKPVIIGEVIGIVFNKKNESIGKKVEVKAKKVNENTLTIAGSNEYYVKVVGE